MFVIGFRKGLVPTFWRCLHKDTRKAIRKCGSQSKTSGIIVTGDEVLRGQVRDTNSHYLCKELYSMGIQVLAVTKVADDINAISEEVKKFSQKYDYVLMTGGIGPTHDDVTYEAVAKAFNDKLYHHPDLTKLVLEFYKTNNLDHPALKMAHIPTTAKLTYGFDTDIQQKALYPTVSVGNVYIYPGVPYLCERLFDLAKDQLFSSALKFHLKELYLTANESLIVGHLNEAVDKFPAVTFGSYPKFFHSYYTVKITIQSGNQEEVHEAFDYLRNLIPEHHQTDYDGNPYSNKMNKITRFKQEFFLETLHILESLFSSKKNSDDIFVYFDGGKNSTVLLYIVSAVFEKFFPQSTVNAIYVETNPKVRTFVTECVDEYKLNLLKLSENHFKNFVSSSRDICIIRGTRKSDPRAGALVKDLASVNIVNPIYNWRYGDVWHVIRSLCLPYCELYDQGYTSISQMNSNPNPNLKTDGPRSDLVYYKKAFELEDEKLEYAV